MEENDNVRPEAEPKPQASGTRRPPGPPTVTGTETPAEPTGPLSDDTVIITRRGKPVAVLESLRKKKDRGQQARGG